MKIISLTSIPSRFDGLGPILESLVAQNVDEVRLYIPNRYLRFADWNGSLPDVPEGVTICRTEDDLGLATKILPACRDFWGQDAQILFCDDDCLVEKGWADRLFRIQGRRPSDAVAVYVRPVEGYVPNRVKTPGIRAWQLPIKYDVPFRLSRLLSKFVGTPTLRRRPFVIPGYGEIFFGVAGVVVRPEFFDEATFDIPPVAWPVDDIWLSANLARLNVRIYCPWMVALPISSYLADQDSLQESEFEGKKRQELNRNAAQLCQQKFQIWG
ncbi:MAG: glycosyltransferase family 2 protein [Parvibaculum sp.]|uniref:glycosyltransferase family 2 protein n=1 Tax=Parvibaculum sp. TaxID=2024848 RepID=UPI00272092E4|nr:glycosyltransferase family 2 protein [Parvibaculum sp.]MDO8837369.1 glycosyltransferase family 2 protein [Parvibaculum sp.]